MTNHTHNPFTGNENYWWYRAKAKLLKTYFGKYVAVDAHVLDIGSADGPAVHFITERIKNYGKKIAMDIVPDGLGPDDIVASAEDIPLEDNSLDIVSAFDVIEHVENEHKGLSEIYRILKPGGYFFMAVPAYQWAWSRHDVELHHHRRYTTGRAEKALKNAGFSVVKKTYAFNGVFPFFALQRIFSKLTRSYSGEVPNVSKFQERLLLGLCKKDIKKLEKGKSLPFGSSVFVLARKV